MRWSHGITNTMDMGLGGIQEFVMDSGAWGSAIRGVIKSQSQLSD